MTDPLHPDILRTVACCSKLCLNRLDSLQLCEARQRYEAHSVSAQRTWLHGYLRDHMSPRSSSSGYVYSYNIGAAVVCEKAWKLALGVKERRLRDLKRMVESKAAFSNIPFIQTMRYMLYAVGF